MGPPPECWAQGLVTTICGRDLDVSQGQITGVPKPHDHGAPLRGLRQWSHFDTGWERKKQILPLGGRV